MRALYFLKHTAEWYCLFHNITTLARSRGFHTNNRWASRLRALGSAVWMAWKIDRFYFGKMGTI